MQDIEVKSLPITLAQFLKWSGVSLTGGQAKEIIHAGLVGVNGSPCLEAGHKLQPNDIIEVEQRQFKLILAD